MEKYFITLLKESIGKEIMVNDKFFGKLINVEYQYIVLQKRIINQFPNTVYYIKIDSIDMITIEK